MTLFGQVNPESAGPVEGGAVASAAPVTMAHDDLSSLASGMAAGVAGFDPAVHAVNPDGTPKLRGDGSFAKKRGRKPGQKSASGLIVQTAATADKLSNEEAARQVCNFAIGAAVSFIGDEWAPVDTKEADGLVLTLKNYFDAKGQVNLPPEAGLVLAFGAYAAKRMQYENTRSKIKGAIRRAVSYVKAAYHYARGTLL